MSRGKDSQSPNKRKNGNGKFDPFIGSKSVIGLDPRNWDAYLNEKEISFVMFYDAEDPQCEWSKKHFLKAAKTTHRINHGYAAVDCIREEELCAREGIFTLPSFKLFMGTKTVDTYTKPHAMTYQTMRKFVENMVITNDPPSHPCKTTK